MMNLKPLLDRVVVRRVGSETVTAGGIVIPDAAAEKAESGTVLAVGTGVRNTDGTFAGIDVREGDQVLFGKTAGQTVKVNGEELLILREAEVLAVINS
jgi:chaperonin GroES